MTKEVNILIQDKRYIITGIFLKACLKFDLEVNELCVLIYLENYKTLDPDSISKDLDIPKDEVLQVFNNLLTKGIIEINTTKDGNGRLIEIIKLTKVYNNINDILLSAKEESNKENIYEMFEKEFGRPLSPMEGEIINAWITTKTSEELILGALKEAVYNGVKNFRYIDKIIYDWNSKGFKTMDDVKKHLISKTSSKPQIEELDYDWLGEDNDEK